MSEQFISHRKVEAIAAEVRRDLFEELMTEADKGLMTRAQVFEEMREEQRAPQEAPVSVGQELGKIAINA